jgi:hypothetical protein
VREIHLDAGSSNEQCLYTKLQVMNSATKSTWRVGSCSSCARGGGAKIIGSTSELGPYDVICGRDKHAYHNVGNRRFRVLVAMNKGRYASVGTRREKTAIVRYLVHAVMRNGGRFLQRHQDGWIELDLKKSMAKVGHAIRDIVEPKPVQLMSPTAAASAVVPSRAPPCVEATGLVAVEEDELLPLPLSSPSATWRCNNLRSSSRRDSVDSAILAWLDDWRYELERES